MLKDIQCNDLDRLMEKIRVKERNEWGKAVEMIGN